MDESFAYFLSTLGPPLARRDVDPACLIKYKGRLPDLLLRYWTEHGFSGYAEGLFWTVDPGDYADVLDTWLERSPFKGQDDYHVIARTAFGCLFVWGTTTGASLQIACPHGVLFPNRAAGKYVQEGRDEIAVQAFFVSMKKSHADFEDEDREPLFARARQKLGSLDHDEMYGFAPALAFGGKATLATLEKVKMREHLEILAQIAAPRIIESPLLA